MIETPEKPTCKVRGLVKPNAMCPYIIVGGKHCGFSGSCEHKSCADLLIQVAKKAKGGAQ